MSKVLKSDESIVFNMIEPIKLPIKNVMPINAIDMLLRLIIILLKQAFLFLIRVIRIKILLLCTSILSKRRRYVFIFAALEAV